MVLILILVFYGHEPYCGSIPMDLCSMAVSTMVVTMTNVTRNITLRIIPPPTATAGLVLVTAVFQQHRRPAPQLHTLEKCNLVSTSYDAEGQHRLN